MPAGATMVQDERLRAAEQLFAREKLLQDMRADALAREKDARRRLLRVCVPLGGLLGSAIGAMVEGPSLWLGAGGAGFGWMAAVLIARRS